MSENKNVSSLPVAVVTGGTRGIGHAIAVELLKEHYIVVVCSREKTRPSSLLFPTYNEHSDFVTCDVSSTTARTEFINYIVHTYGRIDVLVNNAGIAPPERKDILEASEANFEYVLKVNLQGPYFLTQQIAKLMVKWKTSQSIRNFQGMIINISSFSAFTSSITRGEYCISKAGVSMMTKLFADRLAEYEIPVFEIQPGIIATDMTAGVREIYNRKIEAGVFPLKRWGQPEDVGKAVAALVKGEISYSTGQVLHIDGGFHLHRL